MPADSLTRHKSGWQINGTAQLPQIIIYMEQEDPSEFSPLLVNGQSVLVQDTEAVGSKLQRQLKTVIRSRVFLAVTFTFGFLFILWCIVYLGIIPPIIHGAVNGHGSVIKHIHIQDINPITANISVLVPFSDPKPVSANVEFGILQLAALDPESTYTPQTLLGYFTLDPLYIPAQEPEAWLNSSLTLFEPNYSWISWFLKTGIAHGFSKQEFGL